MNRLMIGGTPRDGWKLLDLNPEHTPDYWAHIPPIPVEVKAVQWDEVEWIHGPASLEPWELPLVLKDLRGVVAPEGVLVMETPDARHIARIFAENPTSNLRHVYGDPQHGDAAYMNRWAYTPETLANALHAAGFSRIGLLPAQHHLPSRDFRIEARP